MVLNTIFSGCGVWASLMLFYKRLNKIFKIFYIQGPCEIDVYVMQSCRAAGKRWISLIVCRSLHHIASVQQ